MARRGRRKKKQRSKDLAQKTALLESEIRLDGVGEDPALKAFTDMLSGRTKFSAKERIELGLALQKLQGSTLEDLNPDLVNRLIKEAVEFEKDQQRWEQDREKFLEDIFNEADRTMLTDEERAKIQAKASRELKEATEIARANKHTRQLKLKKIQAQREQTEDLMVEGTLEIHDLGGGQTKAVRRGETISVNGLAMYLKPGLNKDVPTQIAQRYRDMMRARAENEARSEEMQRIQRARSLDAKLKKLDEEFGTASEYSA